MPLASAVDRHVGLAQDACYFHRVDGRHPAEGVEQLWFWEPIYQLEVATNSLALVWKHEATSSMCRLFL